MIGVADRHAPHIQHSNFHFEMRQRLSSYRPYKLVHLQEKNKKNRNYNKEEKFQLQFHLRSSNLNDARSFPSLTLNVFCIFDFFDWNEQKNVHYGYRDWLWKLLRRKKVATFSSIENFCYSSKRTFFLLYFRGNEHHSHTYSHMWHEKFIFNDEKG